MRAFRFLFLFFLLCWIPAVFASEAVPDPDPIMNFDGSSNQMMGNIEEILYGNALQGGLIERLSKAEEDLFGRSLPGTIAERHAAILNFLKNGTEDQPSMLFKLGVAEWVVDKKIAASEAVTRRLERLELNLTGSSRQGNPIVMRVESLIATLVMDPVTIRGVVLPGDTTMKFRFMDELSPAISKVGDRVRLELTNDIIVNQCLVAPAGSLLLTEVRAVKKPRMFGIPGEVRLSFVELIPLGPQRPQVKVGEASQKAIAEARRVGDRGEGAVIGAGATSIAGAALLGPAGLVGGLFIRGNSIRIPAGSVTFVQTSGDIAVSAYPIPASLQETIPADAVNIQSANQNNQQQQSNYDPTRDTIIKGDVFNRNAYGATTYYQSQPSNSSSGGGDFELPPEQQIR